MRTTIMPFFLLLTMAPWGCSKTFEEFQTPEDAFRRFLIAPIPADVSDLQGDGTIWQDYLVFLRFTAADVTIDAILAQGYRPVSWVDIDLPPRYSGSFTPAWTPGSAASTQCFKKEKGSTVHFLLVQRGSGQVHFYGFSM